MWKSIGKCLTACTLLLALRAAAAPPQLTITETGGEVTGLTSGGDSVWLVVSVKELGGMPWRGRIVRVVSDTDRDGVAALELPSGKSAVWIVVDLETGEYAAATPSGHSVVALQAKGRGWAEGVDSAEFDSLEVDSMLVRPRRGVWVNYSEADGRGDADPTPRNLRIRLSDMQQIHGADKKTAGVVLPRDLFVAVDRVGLKVFIRSAVEHGQ